MPVATVIDWRDQLDGPVWIPIIRQAEIVFGIPKDLLCRMAYQESSFKPAVIAGYEKSPPGALGILQLMPEFWSSVRQPIPFSDEAVHAQIVEAARFISTLYAKYGDWAEALAAYNFGPGNEDKYLRHVLLGLPIETQNYVSRILADVPV